MSTPLLKKFSFSLKKLIGRRKIAHPAEDAFQLPAVIDDCSYGGPTISDDGWPVDLVCDRPLTGKVQLSTYASLAQLLATTIYFLLISLGCNYKLMQLES